MSNSDALCAPQRVLHQYTLRVVDPSETLVSCKLEHHKGWDELIMNVNVWRQG